MKLAQTKFVIKPFWNRHQKIVNAKEYLWYFPVPDVDSRLFDKVFDNDAYLKHIRAIDIIMVTLR